MPTKIKLSGFKKTIDKAQEEVPVDEIDAEEKIGKPQSEPQWAVVNSPADEVLAGGAAGGGKSYTLLLLAAKYGRDSIIFRRTYPTLKELIDKSRMMLTGIAKYNSVSKQWRGIPGSRTLEFGAIERHEVSSDFRGRPKDTIMWDEVSEFEERTYQFVNGWNRTHIPGQRCRIVSTCNPVASNSKGYWIKERWAPWLMPSYPGVKAMPGELRWFIRVTSDVSEESVLSQLPKGSLILRRIPDDRQYEIEVPDDTPINYNEEEIKPRSRTFIPMLLSDNPYLRDSNYKTMLQSMPEPLRSQLLNGDWEAGESDDSFQLIPSEWVRAAQKRWSPRPWMKPQVLGVDCSRSGLDETTIAARWENHIAEIKSYPGASIKDGYAIRDLVLLEQKTRDALIVIDVVGVGASPYDALKVIVDKIYGFSGGTKAVDPESGDPLTDRSEVLTFNNMRSYSWWNFREWLDPSNYLPDAILPELPPDERLFADLTSPRWSVRSLGNSKYKGEIVVESKDDIKKRLGRSPDRGDAAVMSLIEWSDDTSAADWLLNI
jgi:hypothetical protein